MTRAVLDTSALTAPVQSNVRLFEELDRLVAQPEPVVPQPVVVELDGLAGDNGTAGTAASVGRDLVERCEVVTTDASYADDAVIEAATADQPLVAAGVDTTRTDSEEQNRVAVTNDHPLRDRLLDRGVRVIGLRGEATLQLNEP